MLNYYVMNEEPEIPLMAILGSSVLLPVVLCSQFSFPYGFEIDMSYTIAIDAL